MKQCKPTHERPVHLNRGNHGNVWFCLTCGKQLAGPDLGLTKEETKVLIEFLNFAAEGLTARHQRPKGKGDSQMRAEITEVVANGLKSSIHALETQITLLKRLVGGEIEEEEETTGKKKAAPAEEEEEEDFGTKKKAAKKKSSFEEEEEEETAGKKKKASFDETEGEEEEEEKSSKKAKKPTLDDVNDACMEALKALGGTKAARSKVTATLDKKFDVTTVTKLEPEQYAAAIKAMEKLTAEAA